MGRGPNVCPFRPTLASTGLRTKYDRNPELEGVSVGLSRTPTLDHPTLDPGGPLDPGRGAKVEGTRKTVRGT